MADFLTTEPGTGGEPGANELASADHLRTIAEDWSDVFAALDWGPDTSPAKVRIPKGHMVYFVGGETGPIKIGFTQQPMKERLKCIQNGSPIKLHVLATLNATRINEKFYHRRFAQSRLHGEWFERTPEILAEIDRLKSLTD